MAQKKTGIANIVDNEYSHLNMTFKEGVEMFKAAHCAGLPLMIYGSPGVGKTSMPRQLFKQLGYDSCIVFTPAQDDVIDWKLPYLDTHVTTRDGKEYTEKISKFAVSERIPRSGRHILVIDELPQASMSLQPTLYSFVLEGTVSGFALPRGCMRVGTGNRDTDGCGSHPISAALRDRLSMTFNLIPDPDTWCEWGSKNNVHPSVTGYVRQSPDCLHGFDPNDVVAGCTPRSLEKLSDLMHANDLYGDASKGNQRFSIKNMETKIFSGVIGRGHGIEFSAFLDIYRNKVDIETILKSPGTAPIPKDGSLSYATIMSLSGHTNPSNFKKIFTYIQRMEPTYTFCYVIDVQNRCPEVVNNPEYVKYLTNNYNLFL